MAIRRGAIGVSSLVISLVLLVSPAVAAERSLTIVVEGASALPAGFERALAASLAPAVEVVDSTATRADARVRVRTEGPRVRIVVEDAVTRKTVERTVSLDGIPEDARAVALASAADGLLRASWLETVMVAPAVPPQDATPVPPRARAIAREALAPVLVPSSQGPRIGARFALEHATLGATFIGGDAVGSLHLFGPLRLALSAGARSMLSEGSPNGRVSGHAFVGCASVGFGPLPSRSWLALEVGPFVELAWLDVRGEAATPRIGAQADGVAGIVGVALAARVPLARGFHLELAPTLGVVARAVRVRDLGAVTTGLDGAVLGVRLAVDAQP
jgi:hypothetical protein